jgi:hypothetical protein
VRQAVFIVCAALAGLALLVAASVAYHHHRRFQGCVAELEAAVRSAKTLDAFVGDPRPDGLYRQFTQSQAGELREVTSMWRSSPSALAEIEAKGRRAHTSAVFLFGDMVYVLFFDAGSRLREFVCLGN